MTDEPGFKGKPWAELVKIIEMEHLTAIRNGLKTKKKLPIRTLFLMDIDHVTAVVKVKEELTEFFKHPGKGWSIITYEYIRDGSTPNGFPMLAERRMKQVEYWLKGYFPNIMRSAKRRRNIQVYYTDNEHPVVFHPKDSEIAVFVAPEIIYSPVKKDG
jgi:hypothetical protein